jgi:8-oxo-dGTP diphosphatase
VKTVHAVVGVLRNSQDEFLVACRPSHTLCAGKWEFPGGKIESGESADAALKRELLEEVDVDVVSSTRLLKLQNRFSDRIVNLDVWTVSKWNNDARGAEGQEIRWVSKNELQKMDFLPGVDIILEALN